MKMASAATAASASAAAAAVRAWQMIITVLWQSKPEYQQQKKQGTDHKQTQHQGSVFVTCSLIRSTRA
jgi:hypothetical protein